MNLIFPAVLVLTVLARIIAGLAGMDHETPAHRAVFRGMIGILILAALVGVA